VEEVRLDLRPLRAGHLQDRQLPRLMAPGRRPLLYLDSLPLYRADVSMSRTHRKDAQIRFNKEDLALLPEETCRRPVPIPARTTTCESLASASCQKSRLILSSCQYQRQATRLILHMSPSPADRPSKLFSAISAHDGQPNPYLSLI